MSPIIRRSRSAEADFREIWRRIAADNSEAADRLLLRIDEKLKIYAAHPHIGRRRDGLSPGLRSFPVGNYVVFYRAVKDGIELVRVLHGARDLNSIFRK